MIGYYPDDPSFVSPSRGRGSAFHSVPARRLLDTRGSRGGPLGYGAPITVIADFGQAVNDSIGSLAVNITVTGPRERGYLVAYASGQLLPDTSTLNFTRGSTVSNMATVQVGRSPANVPTFDVFNMSMGATHLVLDVFGYYEFGDQPGGLHFHPSQPIRIVDTRIGQGAAKLGAGTTTITTPSALIGPQTHALVTTHALVDVVGTFEAYPAP